MASKLFQTIHMFYSNLLQVYYYLPVTGKPSLNFQENVMKWSSFYTKSMKNQLNDEKFVIVP